MNRVRYSHLVIVGFALTVGSCGRDGPTAPATTNPSSLGIFRAVTSASRVVYGPVTFTRDTGKPRLDTASFGAAAGDTLTFVLTPGAVQGLNATVDVNGSRLYSSTPIKAVPDTVRTVARTSNTLRISMAGKPGSSLRIVATVPGPAETRVLSVMYESSVVGATSAGDTALALGSRVHYDFTPHAGFHRLRVVVDGQLAPDSGTLTMDRAHWIAASADTLIALDPSEQLLAQRLRRVLTSSTPRTDWRAYQAAVAQAVAAWGDEADVHLARIHTVTVDPVTDLASLVRLDSALAGMVTPIGLPGAVSSLRGESAPSVMRGTASSSRAITLDTLTDREPTQILLVNGINTAPEDINASAALLAYKVASGGRFSYPRTQISHVYNASLFSLSYLHQMASACYDAFLTSARARGLTLVETLYDTPRYLACVARAGGHGNDISEMLGWAQDAVAGSPQISWEVDSLALLMRSYQNDSLRHVFVIAHSEGSLLTQLAVRRMRDVYGFDEASAPRCVGTISLAGVGTNAWPLSTRHARFVVAKHDIVTMLPGDLRNWRDPSEDTDTRRLDALLAGIEQGGQSFFLTRAVLLKGAKVLGGRQIHRLNRYLRSAEMWPLIHDGLETLYNTCEVKTVLVSPPTETVQLFGTASFTATWFATDGQPLTTSDSVNWSVDTDLANVTRGGRLAAGGTPGTVSLQAKVRNAVGIASITVVDDSVQATYVPPVVTVTERMLTDYQFTYPDPLQGQPGLPPLPFCGGVRFMTITASAMPGASIASVVLYSRSIATPYEYFPVNPPLDTEFVGATRDCVMPWGPVPDDADFSWYRLVVTDTHGKVTETMSPNP
jgi:hypothetical protein